MFEDSLVESQNRLASKNRRWITAGSIGVQCLVAGTIIAVPMMHPEALPFRTIAPAVVVPPLRKPPVVVPQEQPRVTAATTSLPSIEASTRPAMLRSLHPSNLEEAMEKPDSVLIGSMTDTGIGSAIIGSSPGSGTQVTVAAPKHTAPVRVSAGVSSGMLLTEIRPVYPRIAVLARQEGTVVIEATISKTGAIESAHVVSGPAMLQGAAIDAVKVARYKPFLLNNDPTEVQTTITVVFRLGSGG